MQLKQGIVEISDPVDPNSFNQVETSEWQLNGTRMHESGHVKQSNAMAVPLAASTRAPDHLATLGPRLHCWSPRRRAPSKADQSEREHQDERHAIRGEAQTDNMRESIDA
jgi:hypothetical protein